MIPSFECDYDFDAASARVKQQIAALVAALPPQLRDVRLPADAELPSAELTPDGAVFIVREGCLKLFEGERPLIIFEEGEAVALPAGGLRLSAPDFSVLVDVVT